MIENLEKIDFEIAGALRRLFKQKYILKNKNLKWYQTIVDHEKALTKNLTPWLLKLVINESLGIIYLDSLSEEIEEHLEYQLGRKQPLMAFSTLLLLFIRQKRLEFFLNPDNNEAPLVETSALRDFANQFNQNKLDHTFERQFRKALEELSSLQILNELNAESGLYEITAVCEILLPAEELSDLRQKIHQYFQQTSLTHPPLTQKTLEA